MIDFLALIRNEYAQFTFKLLGSIILAKIFHFILKKYVTRIASKTKSDIDDIILKIVTRPLYTLIIFIGVYLAFKSLTISGQYTLWLNRTFFVGTILIIAMLLGKILTIFICRWLKVHKRYEKTPHVLSKIIVVVIYLLAFITILSYFGIEITPIAATLGLGGLAIGLALQPTLSNFFAGLHIISDKPVRLDDHIELPESNISGYVEDIGWRSTRIKTLPNTRVIVPNSKLAESIIVNNNMPEHEMSTLVQCGVAYNSDLKKVEKVTIDVATKIQQTIPGAVKDFVPFIRFHTFSDSNINFSVILRVENFVDKYLVSHELIKALKERYDKEGIEISWPVRKIYQGKK